MKLPFCTFQQNSLWVPVSNQMTDNGHHNDKPCRRCTVILSDWWSDGPWTRLQASEPCMHLFSRFAYETLLTARVVGSFCQSRDRNKLPEKEWCKNKCIERRMWLTRDMSTALPLDFNHQLRRVFIIIKVSYTFSRAWVIRSFCKSAIPSYSWSRERVKLVRLQSVALNDASRKDRSSPWAPATNSAFQSSYRSARACTS